GPSALSPHVRRAILRSARTCIGASSGGKGFDAGMAMPAGAAAQVADRPLRRPLMDYMDDDNLPSLGETRAANPPGGRPPDVPHGSFVQTPASRRTTGMPRTTPPGRPTRTVHTSGPSMSGAAQFCGTCGARISGAEAFCGQCGTPVGQSGDEYTSAHGVSNSAP